MNLICFPHYTAGGLLCEVLNSDTSEIGDHGGFENIPHEIGKIGDDDQIFDTYNPDDLYTKVNNASLPENVWVGTHCWPGLLDLSRFDKIINVTTATYRSRIYRWARTYTLYLDNRGVNKLSGLDKIDKMRLLAKNYIKPFAPVYGDNVVNLEFSSIVDFDRTAHKIIGDSDRYNYWKSKNIFLYNVDFWNSDIVKRFHEAEYEIVTGSGYVYQ